LRVEGFWALGNIGDTALTVNSALSLAIRPQFAIEYLRRSN